MKYLTGFHALNTTCSLNTCGDWHPDSVRWDSPNVRESDGSFFGDYGIETNRKIPEYEEQINVANHIRACLDLLYEGNYVVPQGMRNDYIVTKEYNDEIFDKVFSMRCLPNWEAIDKFMHKEYRMDWIKYLKMQKEAV